MSYCARTDIESQFGADNVLKWADIDNDGDADKITARIVWAIEMADADIDDRLRDGSYVVPIVGILVDPPKSIELLSARLAGVMLYDSRGIQDFDHETGAPIHRLQWFVKKVETTIDEILSGRRRLSAATTLTHRAPEVVTDA